MHTGNAIASQDGCGQRPRPQVPRHAGGGALQLQPYFEDIDRDLHDGRHHAASHACEHGVGGWQWLSCAVAHPATGGAKGVEGDCVLKRDGGKGVGHAFEQGTQAFPCDGVPPALQRARVGAVGLLQADAHGVERLACEYTCNTA